MKLFGKREAQKLECTHDWYYESPLHRMCKKCGERQRYKRYGEPFGAEISADWDKSYLIFSDWLDEAKKYKQMIEKRKQEEEKEKKYFASIGGN